ncbi:DUF1127 domain-containing protein [Salinisphaera aquimarina]|uniref:DUF1127 domain-containing protein n=1 Tax=Salinisphaera aquimarina TaxID=2094031 RepID=A0ABV7EK22_9GAMM
MGLTRLVETLRYYRSRRHTRRQLRVLEDRLLDDIGVSKSDARRESRKPFWQA